MTKPATLRRRAPPMAAEGGGAFFMVLVLRDRAAPSSATSPPRCRCAALDRHAICRSATAPSACHELVTNPRRNGSFEHVEFIHSGVVERSQRTLIRLMAPLAVSHSMSSHDVHRIAADIGQVA
jgi:hypothetical protein